MSAPDQQGQTEEYAGNPIPMTPHQMALLLEEIAKLDTERFILEPGAMLADTGTVLNLSLIRQKALSPAYTLPEMLMDLNSICEPFLNQSPSHAQYAKGFLENANEAIVIAVRDAQVNSAGYPADGTVAVANGDPNQQQGHVQYAQPGQDPQQQYQQQPQYQQQQPQYQQQPQQYQQQQQPPQYQQQYQQQPMPPQQQQYQQQPPPPQQQQQYVQQDGSMYAPPNGMVNQQNGQGMNGTAGNSWVMQVVGEDGNGQMQPGGAMQNQQQQQQQQMPHQHQQQAGYHHQQNGMVQQGGQMGGYQQQHPQHQHQPPHHGGMPGGPPMPNGPGGMPEAVGDSSFVGKKRQRMDKPGGPGAPGAPPMKAASGAPRSRVEGRRCEVCAVIKKAGCGTENAHFRCLKRKLPEGAQELERRVGELVDVGKEERVTVWNPKEGRKLSGQAAPMLKNLVGWLASHPGWEAHPRGSSPVARKVTNNGSSAPPAQAPAGHHLAPAPAPPASVPVHVPMPVPVSQQDPIPSRT